MTSRANAGRAGGEELRRLQAVFDSALDAVFTMDADGTITDWNRQAEAVFGWSKSEAVGRTLSETIIPPADRYAHQRGRFQATGDGPADGRIEITALHRDGHHFPIELSIAPIGSGQRDTFSGFVRDITNQVTVGRHLAVEYATTRALSDSGSFEEAVGKILPQIGEMMRCEVAGLWTAADEASELRCAEFWHATSVEVPEFEAASRRSRFVPGIDLPGRVWASRIPEWVPDFAADMVPRARAALKDGLHGAFGFPILTGGSPIGVIEFLSRDIRKPDHDLLRTLDGVGSRMGEFIQRRRVEDALRGSEDRFRSIFFEAAAGQVLVSPGGDFLAVNRAFCDMTGYTQEELLADGRDAITFAEDRDLGAQEFARLFDREIRYFHLEKRYLRKDGSVLWALLSVSSVVDEGGAMRYLIHQLQDITGRKQAEAALREQTQLYEALLKGQSDLGEIVILSEGEKTIYMNPALLRISGYSREELLALPSRSTELVPTDHRSSTSLPRGTAVNRYKTDIVRKDGQRIDLDVTEMPFDMGGRRLTFTLARDMTESNQAQQALEHQSAHDSLTDLPNRVLLVDRVARAIAAAQRVGGSLALLVLDLDHFKEVNDTFGHNTGDALLKEFGPRLRTVLREGDTVARLGGDEFAVLLEETDRAGANIVAQNLTDVLERAFEVEGQPLDLEASVGMAIYPDDGADADAILRRAEIAMFVAKRSPGAHVSYTLELENQGASRLGLMAELRIALHDQQLVLHYQPLVNIKTGAVVRMEALLRWEHPERGLLPPASFIPFAEKTRLIQPLTRWVLKTALAQSRIWRGAGLSLPVAVNVSMRDLLDPELPAAIGELLERAGAQPDWLGLEITESVIMADPERALDTLSRLRLLGIRLGIDDFGTGYSSLAYLHRLPVDEIKVDRSLVYQMTGAPSRAAIVRASADLGHSLRLETVAEGVEDGRTWDLLAALGYDTAQGDFISRALPAADVIHWLGGWKRNSLNGNQAMA